MSDKEAKVSIIIPIYNASKYLEETLQSIINQTYKELEIILVNDASPDLEDEKICKRYVGKDKRIKYWKLSENSGPGEARNFGFLHSTGDYILFFDADDILVDNGIELLVSLIKRKDIEILSFSAVTFYENKDSKILKNPIYYRSPKLLGKVVDGKTFLSLSIHDGTLWMPSWLNVFDRKFLLKIFRKYRFPKNNLHEDTALIPIIYNLANKIYVTHFSPVLHRVHKNSTTGSNFNWKRAESYISSAYFLFNYLNNSEIDINDPLFLFFENLFNWLQEKIDSQDITINRENSRKLQEINEWLFSKILERRQFENVNFIKFHGLLHIKGTFVNKTWYLLNKIPILKVSTGNFFKCYSIPLFPFICIKRKIKHV